MLKRCLDFERDFNDACKVYDLNLKDFFGRKFYIIFNEEFNEIRFMSKNKEYYRNKKIIKDKKLKVINSKWGNVIDITEEAYKKIALCFNIAKLPYIGNLNIGYSI